MMGSLKPKFLGLATLTTALISTSAIAGGFDRGGVNIDHLFNDSRMAIDSQASYVMPNRKQLNVKRADNVATAAPNDGISSAEVNGSVGFWVPRVSYKQQIGENFNCLFSYSEPYGADQENGYNNALSASSVDFELDTQDYGATCSYSFSAGSTSVGDSSIRVIGGLSYQELDGFLSRQSLYDFASIGLPSIVGTPAQAAVEAQVQASIDQLIAAGRLPAGTTAAASPTNTLGLGTFSVSGDAVGWRAGLAYEIPDIALRASVVYQSSYDFDLTGIQDNTGFGIAGNAANATAPISAFLEMPQALEIKLQSGIAEGTLAFANFKWQDWSKVKSIPVVGGITSAATANVGGGVHIALPTTLAFEPLYRDGYTVTVGLGKQITEELSGLASLTWDRGTATTSGSQTDSWTLSGGLNYKSDERFDIRVGGAVGLLTGGISTGEGSTDTSNLVYYSFDDDYLLAASAGFKLKF